MWEFEVISDQSGREYIKYLQANLGELVSKLNGVMAIMTDGENLFLSIGAKQENAPEIKAHLRLLLCDIFCEKMKLEYISDNLDLPENKQDLMTTFVKVCTYFDRETERQIVMKTLLLKEKKMHLQSFLRFKLQGLMQKWQELCDLVNQNSGTILKQENFIELLRFLLNSIDSKCQSVILELHDKCLIYHDIKSDFDVITAIDVENMYDILSKIIDLNPYLIKIYATQDNSELVSLLRSVFDDKVQLG